MYQLFYWLAAFAKTVSLLSLLILIPDNPFHKQLYSKAFLILYFNEIVLFLMDALVNMFSQPQFGQYFPLSQAIMNIYFFVIITIVIVWLVRYQMNCLSDKFIALTTIVISFVWMAVVCVGIAAMATRSIQNVRSLGELAYALAWMMSLFKFIIQYRVNSLTNTFGLGFIFLFTNISWIVLELLSKTLQKWPNEQNQQQQTQFNTTTMIFITLLGLISLSYNMVMIKQRKAMINKTREIQRQQEKLRQVGVGIAQSVTVDQRERERGTTTFNVDERACSLEQALQHQQQYGLESVSNNTLKDSLLIKDRKYTPSAVTTKYSTSFADSIENL